MKTLIVDAKHGRMQPGGAYLRIENDRVLLGVWAGDRENVMALTPTDLAGIKAFLNGVTAYSVDGASLPNAWHVSGHVQAIHDHE